MAFSETATLLSLVEVREPLKDFTGCMLYNDSATLYPDGDIYCPPEKGGWTGKLRWNEELEWYEIHYNVAGLGPTRARLILDLNEARRMTGRLREAAEAGLETANRIEGLIRRAEAAGIVKCKGLRYDVFDGLREPKICGFEFYRTIDACPACYTPWGGHAPWAIYRSASSSNPGS